MLRRHPCFFNSFYPCALCRMCWFARYFFCARASKARHGVVLPTGYRRVLCIKRIFLEACIAFDIYVLFCLHFSRALQKIIFHHSCLYRDVSVSFIFILLLTHEIFLKWCYLFRSQRHRMLNNYHILIFFCFSVILTDRESHVTRSSVRANILLSRTQSSIVHGGPGTTSSLPLRRTLQLVCWEAAMRECH